jgi:hypothetical protein
MLSAARVESMAILARRSLPVTSTDCVFFARQHIREPQVCVQETIVGQELQSIKEACLVGLGQVLGFRCVRNKGHLNGHPAPRRPR